jgi:two-component system response regulator GlrR
MTQDNILVVDDDRNILEVLRLRLETQGYGVWLAKDSQQALQLMKEQFFDLALIDLKLCDDEADGLSLMLDVHQRNPDMPVIILTAYGTIENAVEAMKRGAYSYLTKPFEIRELLIQIKNGLEKSGLSREIKRLKGMLQEQFGLQNIIGKSAAMREVLQKTTRAAEADSNVFIYGESGTGKELIAKSLHLLSTRKENPFVAVNCSSIPEGLLESELFGHEKGAFTGAVKKKKGMFSLAHTGTLFLDEISETPPSMQAKLLRVLEEKEFYPLGGERSQTVDVRIIAASNQDLATKVNEGSFREDLFYRLHVIPIHLPPLRERTEDIPLLANHFLRKYADKMHKQLHPLSPFIVENLMSYSWPGNVRELENAVEYAVAMSSGRIREDDFFLHMRQGVKNDFKPLKQAKNAFEKDYISRALLITQGNVSKAASLVGKHRADFYELLKKHNLKLEQFKAAKASTTVQPQQAP